MIEHYPVPYVHMLVLAQLGRDRRPPQTDSSKRAENRLAGILCSKYPLFCFASDFDTGRVETVHLVVVRNRCVAMQIMPIVPLGRCSR